MHLFPLQFEPLNATKDGWIRNAESVGNESTELHQRFLNTKEETPPKIPEFKEEATESGSKPASEFCSSTLTQLQPRC